MGNYKILKICEKDRKTIEEIETLLFSEGIKRDKNLEYTCVALNEEDNIVGTGSCFGNTLRCLAVSKEHQGKGLMNKIILHLLEYQYSQGKTHLFVYTKNTSAKFFKDLGFYEIANLENSLVFLENKRTGFQDYLNELGKTKIEKPKIAALVMNCNPFTLGHQYLIEKAAAENDAVHLFMVSDNSSLIPFSIRKKLILEGTKYIENIIYHETGSYIISKEIFPSYFQKDEIAVIRSQVSLDIELFIKIARKLGITRRYVGEEINSEVTSLYNHIMKTELPKNNIECIEISRKRVKNNIISASTVRQAIKNGDMDKLEELVPKTTLDFFKSEEAKALIKKIKKEKNVIHY